MSVYMHVRCPKCAQIVKVELDEDIYEISTKSEGATMSKVKNCLSCAHCPQEWLQDFIPLLGLGLVLIGKRTCDGEVIITTEHDAVVTFSYDSGEWAEFSNCPSWETKE